MISENGVEDEIDNSIEGFQYDAWNLVRKPSVRVSNDIYLCNIKLFK